jgi:hypothetical protein
MADDQDLALRAIERIAYMWRLDETKIVRITRSQVTGFDWWPGDFRVRVRAEWSTVLDTVRLVIRTDVLKDVPVADELFISLVAEMSCLWAPTYAWVYPPAPFWEKYHQSNIDDVPSLSPRLGFSSSAYISSENIDWLTDFLARATILQPVSAQSHSDALQRMLEVEFRIFRVPIRLRTVALTKYLMWPIRSMFLADRNQVVGWGQASLKASRTSGRHLIHALDLGMQLG